MNLHIADAITKLPIMELINLFTAVGIILGMALLTFIIDFILIWNALKMFRQKSECLREAPKQFYEKRKI